MLTVKNSVPICLNTILCKAHTLLAGVCGNSNVMAAANHLQITGGIRTGILWGALKLTFYDFDLTSNACNSIFTVATFYPRMDWYNPRREQNF
ncbi:hypothetical protein JVT61DRAFT_3743 [Boletus reticuloceps]|uniref:Uncharacterized protein n=1 Tax=Boletus reticuloceps TaxID=495285 RepID=A0A8I2YLW7_9AGAM|nr:hypothetical protein JVT61DRAFT_3743 [Boletus reticuloceps]